MVESLPERLFPFGHPHQIRRGENKLRQLSIARSVGFSIPPTCATNDRSHLISFAAEHPELVVKPLFVGSTIQANGRECPLQSAVISAGNFTKMISAVAQPECLFVQERIRKESDVRTFVSPGGKCRSFAIDTKHYDEASVDWRMDSMTLSHNAIETPAAVVERIRLYLEGMQLTSGSFDFGVTKEGEWVFFECNPNGQWLWLELKTGVELARDVASVLIRCHQENHVRS
jgi:hypothetical protein